MNNYIIDIDNYIWQLIKARGRAIKKETDLIYDTINLSEEEAASKNIELLENGDIQNLMSYSIMQHKTNEELINYIKGIKAIIDKYCITDDVQISSIHQIAFQILDNIVRLKDCVNYKNSLLLVQKLLSNTCSYIKTKSYNTRNDIKIEEDKDKIFIAKAIIKECINNKVGDFLLNNKNSTSPQNLLELLIHHASANEGFGNSIVAGEFFYNIIEEYSYKYMPIPFFTLTSNQDIGTQDQCSILYDLCVLSGLMEDNISGYTAESDIRREKTHFIKYRIKKYQETLRKKNSK